MRLFYFTSSDPLNFIEHSSTWQSNEPIHPDTPISDRIYVKLYFRADAKHRVYEREVESIVDYMGDIGGILEVVSMFGIMLTGFFVQRALKSEMVKEVYQV